MAHDGGEEVTAAQALSYGLSRDVLLLFGSFPVGRMLPLLGRWLVDQRLGVAHGSELLITAGTWLLGLGITFATIVGFAFKLLEDSRA